LPVPLTTAVNNLLNDHPFGCITVNTSLNGLDTDLTSSNETVSVIEQLLVVAELLRSSDLSNKKAENKKSMVALQQTSMKIPYFGIEENNYYSYCTCGMSMYGIFSQSYKCVPLLISFFQWICNSMKCMQFYNKL